MSGIKPCLFGTDILYLFHSVETSKFYNRVIVFKNGHCV